MILYEEILRTKQEETSGAAEMQQWHKESRPERMITSGKQENTQQDLQADHRAEVTKQIFRTSIP
jgi:hypothetical protein